MRPRFTVVALVALAVLLPAVLLSPPSTDPAQAHHSASRARGPKPKPTTTVPPTTTTPPPSGVCTNPWFSTSDPNDGVTVNGYYVHNNAWAVQDHSQTLYVCSHDSWYTLSGPYSGTSVKTYPNVHRDVLGSCCGGLPWSNFSTVTSTFASAMSQAGIWNVAFDIWLDRVGWGGGSTEVMIWTENRGQRPAGSPITTFDAPDGLTYEVWRYYDGDANVVSFVSPVAQTAGTLDLKAFVDFGIGRGLIPTNPTVHQIGYGVEVCDTAGQVARYDLTGFSLTMGSP